MRLAVFLLLILTISTIIHSTFELETVDVTVSDIKQDGSAKVQESIKFLIYGELSQTFYDSAVVGRNDISYWSSGTGIGEIKYHIDPALVDFQNITFKPVQKTFCNSATPRGSVCHGELILDYVARPFFNGTSPVSGTGLFSVIKSKPRTNEYTINPNAFSFTPTLDNHTYLDATSHLTIIFPENSQIRRLDPFPRDVSKINMHYDSLTWNEVLLVNYVVVFDVEDGIDKEINDFLGSIYSNLLQTFSGLSGAALLILVLILISFFIYINAAKKRGE